MATTQLDTVPNEMDVTTAMARTWTLDFSPALADAETLDGAEAVLISTATTPGRAATIPNPIPPPTTIPAFVQSATVVGQTVAVAWDGTGLTIGATYVLHTRATVDNANADVVVLLTRVRVVG